MSDISSQTPAEPDPLSGGAQQPLETSDHGSPQGLRKPKRPALWLALLLLLVQPGSNLLYSGRWRLGWWITGLYLALQLGSLAALLLWAPQTVLPLALAVGLLVSTQVVLFLIALFAGAAAHLRYRRKGIPDPLVRLGAGHAVALALFLSAVQGLIVLRLMPQDSQLTLHTFTIPSGSMMPAYQIGDVIAAVRPTRPLERGQALVFKPSDAPDTPYYIKRLIGLPGDLIAVDGHRAIVNGDPEQWSSRAADDPGAIRACLAQHCYDLQIDRPGLTGPGSGANMSERVLGPDEYFFLGDHRDQSLDSRFDRIGRQPKRRIFYRAMLTIWPLDRLGRLDAPGDHR